MLAGCASTPPPALKPGDVPAAFEQKAAGNAPVWPAKDWWTNYGDPQLAALMDQAQANNLDIAQAAARLRQADARARQAGAALLPQVGAGANVNTLYGQANGTSLHETDYSAGLDASYELDFWGKNRDLLDSAKAALRASEADRATVALTVTSGVANTYFQLLSLRERLAVARANLKSAQDILGVVQRRVTAGFSANADLLQQRAALAAEQAALPALEQQELEARNALAILLGRPPEGFTVDGRKPGCAGAAGRGAGAAVRAVDAASRYRRPPRPIWLAAHADLAAARTAYSSRHHPDRQWRRGLSGAGGGDRHLARHRPGGRRRRRPGANHFRRRQDPRKDRGKPGAGGRIAGGLSRRGDRVFLRCRECAWAVLPIWRAQEAALREQVTQAEKVLNAAQRKYLAGSADFLVVTDAQRALYTARDQLSDIRRARLAASVALFKAMGGGFVAPAISEATQ